MIFLIFSKSVSSAVPHLKSYGLSFELVSGVSVPMYFCRPQMNFFIHWIVPKNFLTALGDFGVGQDRICVTLSLSERMPLAKM
jgi:hypothetical protein